ncbi:MAG TPA: bifunctional YncE family protein/alkaline phosphatase family protein [Thermoleophilia bacterium]|nr:bifunctional YncE family protein/alkaline phosphatase family protein [Thermoleophilia bacterium]
MQYETTELFDVASGRRTALRKYDGTRGASVFYGVVFSSDGHHAWAAGAGQDVVHAYAVTTAGGLRTVAEIKAPFFPSGLAYGHTPLGDRLYVTENLGADSQPSGGPESHADPPGHTVTVIDPATEQVTARIELGVAGYPLGIAFDRQGTKAYVADWAGRCLSVIDTAKQRTMKTIVLSPLSDPLVADHPTGVTANPVRDEMYVADANTDTVSVIDTASDAVSATIDVALVPGAPKGSMPVGLCVSPDGGTLYVADAGENAVAVIDLGTRRVLGFVPTGWYPSSVQVTPDGKQLVVTNTYGSGAGPNTAGPFVRRSLYPTPAPGAPYYYYPGDWYKPPVSESQYIGTMIRGSVEVIDLPDAGTRQSALTSWTAQVRANDHAGSRWSQEPSALAGIKHVIYVVKENRTYDQVFGDLGKGNGDPALTLFGESCAPNQRALASRFVLLDDFDVDSQVSQDGHPWTTQGDASDYVHKIWPFDYAWAYSRAYDSENIALKDQFRSEPLASDTSIPRSVAAETVGYLWDDAWTHHVSFRDYGESTGSKRSGGKRIWFSDLTHLQSRFGEHVDPRYVGWDMAVSDHLVREPEWEREFRAYEADGRLPGLEIVYLPMDHTEGMTPHSATPQSYMADNDLALGRLVDAVSHSQYWRSTAIFVVEDDAQDGPDHVDAHRSPCLVISPYTQHATVDSTHHDTAAVLSTIEHLLGLSPMSVYDQRATPLWAAFSGTPDTRPYTVVTPQVTAFGDSGYPKIASTSALARLCARQDFSQPDAADEDVLNKATWMAVKGSLAGYPPQ